MINMKDIRLKIGTGVSIFIFTYLSVWLSFWALSVIEHEGEALALPYKLGLSFVSIFGYAAFIVSIPIQMIVQNIFAALGVIPREVFGVVTYPSWVTFFVTASTTTMILVIVLALLPLKKKNKS